MIFTTSVNNFSKISQFLGCFTPSVLPNIFSKIFSVLGFLSVLGSYLNFFQKIFYVGCFPAPLQLFQKNCPFSSVALFLLGVLNFLQKICALMAFSWSAVFTSTFFQNLLRWSVPALFFRRCLLRYGNKKGGLFTPYMLVSPLLYHLNCCSSLVNVGFYLLSNQP